MPEGDTVHKIAARLRDSIEGQRLPGLWLRDRGWVDALADSEVSEVAAVGKHLLVVLASERTRASRWVLHVHLGMRGRWHVAKPGEPWRLPARDACVRLALVAHEWIGFRAAVAELLRPAELEQHPSLSRLGPDLLDASLDLERVVARARALAPPTVSDLLLDQRVACGLGNVYRNELLFLEGLAPSVPGRALADETIRRLYTRGRALLQANLGGWRRTTTRIVSRQAPLRRGEPRAWVYDRQGRPCLRCETIIRASRAGDMARASYWCPHCQPVSSAHP